MRKDIKIFVFVVLLLVALFLRDVPYLNIVFVPRMYLIYIALFFFLFPPKTTRTLFFGILLLLFLTIIVTVLQFMLTAELLGVILYFVLWVLVLSRIVSYIKSI